MNNVPMPIDLDLESEIEQTLRRHAPQMPPPLTSLDDLGRMSAEAVLAQYEETARQVEEMGSIVKDTVKRLGEKLIECNADMKHVAETAAAIRDKGKHTEALIDQVTALSKSIRDACIDFKRKVGT